MGTTLKKSAKSDMNVSGNNQVKRLSKVGEWMKSGQSALTILDMRAVLR